MYTLIDVETRTGDLLDDAVYERDRNIEEIFNVKLDVREAAIDDLADLVRTSVMAGDQSYDAAYIKGDHLNGIITDGCVLDLTNVDGLKLDKPYDLVRSGKWTLDKFHE